MKRTKVLFCALMFLPLALTLAMLVVLPDLVPMHYNVADGADRWGSKFENLIFPVVTAVMGLFFLGMRWWAAKRGEGRNEKILLITGCGTLGYFNVMTAVFLFQAYQMAVKSSAVTMDISRILFTAAGILFVALGNVLPKLRRSRLFGTRTAWTEENEDNWRKGQMAGGIVFIAAGLVLTVGNVFFVREERSAFFSVVCLLLIVPVLLIAIHFMKQKR